MKAYQLSMKPESSVEKFDTNSNKAAHRFSKKMRQLQKGKARAANRNMVQQLKSGNETRNTF